VEAIQLEVSDKATNKYDKIAAINTDICIGCGVCVHKCPTESIVLEHREDTTRPPKTGRDWSNLAIADRLAAIGKHE
jgi:formate hydrogenlyase subunit 6/NADH:ubiquinone oxidoreductase subunit I